MMRLILRGLVLAVMTWGAGLVWFVADALTPSAPPPAAADGIVVLTGDADRVNTALELLDQGHGRRLLISGAGPGVSLAGLARRNGYDPARLSPKVTLGRQAISTWGNGDEFAAWAAQNHLRSALVVTSFYHMRRALLEISRAAPGVQLFAVKVPAAPALDLTRDPSEIRKLFEDYNKYLAALIGLSRFSPGHRSA